MNTIIVLGIIVILWSVWGFYGSRVEQAQYTVLKKMDGYEIREYPAHIVAQTKVSNSLKNPLNSGFSIVAGYIFGDNKKMESIAMTAPVVSQTVKDKKVSENIAMTAPVLVENKDDYQIVSFGMPSSYTIDILPVPNDSRVEIVTIAEKKYAVLEFSWYRSQSRIDSMQEKLLNKLTKDGIKSKGNFSYAGYNAPWTPPWMNRNEVLIEVE